MLHVYRFIAMSMIGLLRNRCMGLFCVYDYYPQYQCLYLIKWPIVVCRELHISGSWTMRRFTDFPCDGRICVATEKWDEFPVCYIPFPHRINKIFICSLEN